MCICVFVWGTGEWGSFLHTSKDKQFSDTSEVSYNLTQDNIRFHRLRVQSFQSYKTVPHPTSDWPAIDVRVLASSLGSINLLQLLTKFRETFYLLGWGTARWERCRRQAVQSFCAFSKCAASPKLREFTTQKLWGASPCGFPEGSSHRPDCLNH